MGGDLQALSNPKIFSFVHVHVFLSEVIESLAEIMHKLNFVIAK